MCCGTVELDNGKEVGIEGRVNVHVKVQQYQPQVPCLTTQLSDAFDIILGDDWLQNYKAHIDYDLKLVYCTKTSIGNKWPQVAGGRVGNWRHMPLVKIMHHINKIR